jgi:hypothetical protein
MVHVKNGTLSEYQPGGVNPFYDFFQWRRSVILCVQKLLQRQIFFAVPYTGLHALSHLLSTIQCSKSYIQGVTKSCRLSWLTNSPEYEPGCGWRGGVAGPQSMSTAVHRSPNKLWRSNSIFKLCLQLHTS